MKVSNITKILASASLVILLLTLVVAQDDDVDRVINRMLKEQKVARRYMRSQQMPQEQAIQQEAPTWEFTAEGRADISPGVDIAPVREKAIKDALRNAVEQGVGVFVNSTTLVKNYSVAFDSIFSKADGYVRTFRVIKEWSDTNFYYVRVLAEVGMGQLQDDLVAIQTFKRLVDFPRIMVFGSEKVDGAVQPDSHLVQTAMEGILSDNGYDLVDRTQTEIIMERDELLARTDEEQAALGKRFGADILVYYTADAASAGKDIIYGITSYFYTGVVDCRVIKADTGRLMFSRSQRERRGDEGAPSAAQAALHYAGREMGETLKNDILNSWLEEVLQSGVWLELKIGDITFESAQSLGKHLENLQHINAVRSPSYIHGTAIYQIQANMTASSLAANLLDIPSPRMDIEEVMQNSIKARVKQP